MILNFLNTFSASIEMIIQHWCEPINECPCKLRTAHKGFQIFNCYFIPRMELTWLACLTLCYTAEFYKQKPVLCFWVYVEKEIPSFLFSGQLKTHRDDLIFQSLLEFLMMSSKFCIFKEGFRIFFQNSVIWVSGLIQYSYYTFLETCKVLVSFQIHHTKVWFCPILLLLSWPSL